MQSLKLIQTQKQRQDEGTLLNELGLAYNSLGQRKKALRYYEQVLPIYEELEYDYYQDFFCASGGSRVGLSQGNLYILFDHLEVKNRLCKATNQHSSSIFLL